MLEKKYTKNYIKKLSEKYNIPQKDVKVLMVHGLQNVCRMIFRGQDIKVPHFGNIYFDKNKFSKRLKK